MRLAWLPCALTIALAVAGLVLTPGVLVAIDGAILSMIAVLGALVASRRPENPSGWLLLTIALCLNAAQAGDALFEAEGAVAGAWLTNWIWVPAMVSVALFPLLFPTGRPPEGRWRYLLWLAVAGGPALVLGTALEPGRLDDYPAVRNPLAVSGTEIPAAVGFALLIVLVFGSIAASVVRFRRSRGVERQQLKWMTGAAMLFPLVFLATGAFEDELGFTLLLVGVLLFAVAVAIAILRHRLYDIDLVINRALVYGALTGILGATYLSSVLLLQLVLPARSDLAIAASTLAVAAAFGPARARIQAAVDRRFFRARYDAGLTLAAFGTRLREEVTLASVEAELRDAIADTLAPTHVSMWLREGS